MRKAIFDYVKSGGKHLAECGGIIYLSKEIDNYNMCCVLPIKSTMNYAKLSLGYRSISIRSHEFKGYEFHYSRTENTLGLNSVGLQYNVNGTKVDTPVFKYKNAFTRYTHLYWAEIDIF